MSCSSWCAEYAGYHSEQCARTTAYSAHHELRDTNPHASKRFYLPRISSWLLFTLHSSSLPHTYISPPYMFPCSTEGTSWSSMPRSTHPPATRLCLSRSWPIHNNAPVYCKSTSSTDSELHTSKILIVLLLAITKKKKNVRLMNVKVFETSTSSWLKLHIILVYLLQYVQPDGQNM